MALEAVVFSQDQFNFHNFNGVGLGGSYFSYDLIPNYPNNPFESYVDHNENNQLWDDHNNQQQQYVSPGNSSSPEEPCNCTVEQYYLSADAEAEAPQPPLETTGGGGRRKRRRRSCKNKEEVEQQRMTHIAVERNRRKQMNEYLAVIRSLMPPSYVQRGDQASIVGGAINYVKELEQLLQSLEAHKRTNHHEQPPQPPEEGGGGDDIISIDELRGLWSFPESDGTTDHPNGSTQSNSVVSSGKMNSVQVTMVESHANVRILTKKQPKQLLRLVAGFQGLRLSVLHLNVTSLHSSFLLYSFSLKVEEGCQLNSVDDITAASNHILDQIQEEAAGLL